jgi:hypothetical protein
VPKLQGRSFRTPPMPLSRTQRRHPACRPVASHSPDACFPAAVRGEDYSRYAAAMWGQAVRWLRSEVVDAIDDVTEDAYTVLLAAAAVSVERDLYPQEKQLLSELVHREWDTLVAERKRASPEIPRFLRPPT